MSILSENIPATCPPTDVLNFTCMHTCVYSCTRAARTCLYGQSYETDYALSTKVTRPSVKYSFREVHVPADRLQRSFLDINRARVTISHASLTFDFNFLSLIVIFHQFYRATIDSGYFTIAIPYRFPMEQNFMLLRFAMFVHKFVYFIFDYNYAIITKCIRQAS
ncbi:unnamed protein product [Xylocopa violacea]|uniref:Uncharacterized protein n=1 Tax=Xylocopa violacea TaxID=135666 RepID=A0ABP1NU62_XYLVO